MLDLKLIRKNPGLVRKNLRKRESLEKLQVFEDLLECDKKWRESLKEINDLKHVRNLKNVEIARLKSKGQDANEKIEAVSIISDKIKKSEELVRRYRRKRDNLLLNLPNLLHESVPMGKDEDDNVLVRKWGKNQKPDFSIKSHIDLGLDLDILDLERAAKISGARFYYLKNEGVLLDMALINFALAELEKKGLTPIEPPFMMRKKPYRGVTALSDFQDMLYKIEEEDLYLIATSEHSIAAMFMDEVLLERDLPLKYVGVSPCFRKEAGSHGKDTKGIFRTHQFNKVEQFVFCRPENSWQIHEELLANAEEIFKKLELPYRVVNVCTGDVGTVAAKKYDLEVWMPAQNRYREIVSCSNCTDYQARRLNTKYRETEGKPPKDFVHTINSTAIATGRAIVAILENFQRRDGSVTIPKKLRPFMGGIEKIS